MASKNPPAHAAEDEADRFSPEELESIRLSLVEKRNSINDLAHDARKQLTEDKDVLPDEVDLASAEYEAAFEYRLRDREQYLLKKIEKALERLDKNEYDECESCGGPISKKRLLARPEATLCIICKEEQEQVEKGYLKRRLMQEEEFKF